MISVKYMSVLPCNDKRNTFHRFPSGTEDLASVKVMEFYIVVLWVMIPCRSS